FGPRDQACILERDAALIVEAVEHPGLQLALVQLALVQQAMERVLAVIAFLADLAQTPLEFFRTQQLGHSVISRPSWAAYQPASAMAARSGESASRMGLLLFICTKPFRCTPSRSKAAIV